MENTKKRATIVVFSCDSYEDVWNPFFTLMNKYWKNCKYDIILNSKKYQLKRNYKKIIKNLSTKNVDKSVDNL